VETEPIAISTLFLVHRLGAGMKRSLLIVEDDRDQLVMLIRLFLQAGYDVVAVHHPRLALEAATFRSFHVALLDQGLPEVEGMQLLERLRKLQHGLQIVLLTGQSDPDFKRLAEDGGVFACLAKPCKVRQIEDAVNRACGISLNRRHARIAPPRPAACEGPSEPNRRHEHAMAETLVGD
jgi:DNA-binding NtrC family response regulator